VLGSVIRVLGSENYSLPPFQLQWTTDGGNTLTETVTVAFASPSNEVRNSYPTPSFLIESLPDRTIIKVDSNQARELLRSKTAQLLSSLQPRIFAQLKLQSALASAPGAAVLLTMDSHPPPPGLAGTPHSTEKQIISQPVLSQNDFQASFRQTQNLVTMSVLGESTSLEQGVVTAGHLVIFGSPEVVEVVKGDQNLLGDIQPIPAQIGDNYLKLTNPETTVCIRNVHQEKQVLTSETDRCRDVQAPLILGPTKTVENSE
ncbi:hypothetical protein JD844_023202, partial [Phrynosoma platyrhinos]